MVQAAARKRKPPKRAVRPRKPRDGDGPVAVLLGDKPGHRAGADGVGGRPSAHLPAPTATKGVVVGGDTLRAEFRHPYDLAQYELFIRSKRLPEYRLNYREADDSYTLEAPARFAPLFGVEALVRAGQRIRFPPHLWDYQRHFCRVSLDAKRYAVWADCGLGKTVIFLEWARQVHHATAGRVLILSPKQVIGQTCLEWERFYPGGSPLTVLRTRLELVEWCRHGTVGGKPASPLAICGHHKLVEGQVPEMRYLAGLVVDESSLLKSGGGVIKWNLIHSAKGIEFKLSCTATPAPNDVMEYASQASFLEKLRSDGEILWTFFQKIGDSGTWVVKPHAREAFYRFMAGWSVYLRSPASYGFRDNVRSVPAPTVLSHEIEATAEQRKYLNDIRLAEKGLLFDLGDKLCVTERGRLSQVAKGFRYLNGGPKYAAIPSRKPDYVAELVRQEVEAGRPTLVWTVYDAETEILQAALARAVHVVNVGTLSGKMSDSRRESVMEDFEAGRCQVLISKASLIGFGMNLQFVKSMVFNGWDDSFERFYQAVRRAVRYGQTDSVMVHIPFIAELEGMTWENLQRKQTEFETTAAECERYYRAAIKETIGVQ